MKTAAGLNKKSPVTEGGGHRASGHLEHPLRENIGYLTHDVKKKNTLMIEKVWFAYGYIVDVGGK